MTRYARRVDKNHGEIRDALRSMGHEVLDLSAAGQGVPDLAVKVGLGEVHFLELKDGNKPLSAQALTEAQEQWHNFAFAITSKVRTLEEAVEAIQWAKQRAKLGQLEGDSRPKKVPLTGFKDIIK